uniref:nucleotidyltransferase family protein n=1 Tax=Ndongobacter massiliensis TaxID=1871025 RepID=UPI0009317AFD|nr:nucleotidyltransferase [Ndongobacter massiliensis]
MKEPILVVMAAGMGSRYGGLKQIDPIGPGGERLLDYSIYDALRAGFRRVIFVIRAENRGVFEECVLRVLPKELEARLAFQEFSDLPEGFVPPEGRTKPWGTGHAVRAARAQIDAPFGVINADDYYGPEGFRALYEFLCGEAQEKDDAYALIAYPISHTLTPNGSVSRGICATKDGFLTHITERTAVFADGANAKYTEDGGKSFCSISGDTPCSMNFWGFPRAFLEAIEESFRRFLKAELPKNPLKAEFYLPSAVGEQLASGRARVHMRYSQDQWFGVTYRADREAAKQEMQKRIDRGMYPKKLWDGKNACRP